MGFSDENTPIVGVKCWNKSATYMHIQNCLIVLQILHLGVVASNCHNFNVTLDRGCILPTILALIYY